MQDDLSLQPGGAAALTASPDGHKSALGSFRHVLPINMAVTVGVSSLATLLLLPALPGPWIALWWGAHMAVTILMVLRWRRNWRWPGVDFVISTLSGLIWGAGALFLPHLSQQHQVLLLMIAAGMVAGSSATLATIPYAAVFYILGTGLPYIGFMLLEGGTHNVITALLGIIFIGAMLMTNRIVHAVIRRSRSLRQENTELYERIRAAQRELLDIAESSEAFAFCDADGRLQMWNRRFPDLLGLPEDKLQRGLPLAEILAKAGLPETILQPPPDSDGPIALPSERWLRSRLTRTPQGGYRVVLLDITDQHIASMRLQAQNARLEELFREVSHARDTALRANQAKTTFLANMSHELRTPLNAIIGFSDIVQQKMFGPNSPKYDEYVRDINESAQHLLSIINDILDLARIEANQIVLNETPVDLDEEIATCMRLVSQQFGRGPGTILIDLASDLPQLKADARLIRQILLNLMANAVKFSPAGMPIEAGARRNEKNEIELWVRDHGIGIPPADQARIFEPFEQADMQLSRKYGGIGLGLSLVRAFVSAHQGRVAVESALGRGTCFIATFPAGRTL